MSITSCGGGIIQDQASHYIIAFSSYCGYYAILETKLGLSWMEFHLLIDLNSLIWMEVELFVAVHYITNGGGPCTIQIILGQTKHHLSIDRNTISHTYREGNQSADSVTLGISAITNSMILFHLPRQFWALVQKDRYGLPSIREHYFNFYLLALYWK